MNKTLIKKIVRHPASMLGSAVAGILAGSFFPAYVSWCNDAADAFMQLMKMCVLPILVFSIISSFCRLCSVKKKEFSVCKMLIGFVIGFVVLYVVFSAIVTVIKPGLLSPMYRQELGKLLAESGNLSPDQLTPKPVKLGDVFAMLIPDNIFESLAAGNSIHILFFFLLIGLSIGSLKEKGSILLNNAEMCFSVCLKILDWVMYLLPFGMFALLASQMQSIGAAVLPAMFRYIFCIYAGCVLCYIICTLIISLRMHYSLKKILHICKQPFIIAFATRSSLMAMPSAIDSLVNGFSVTPVNANTVLPLGVMIARYSMMAIYVSATFFAAQLYGVEIQMLNYVTVFLLSLLMAVAGSGAPAMVSLSMLSAICVPLQIPFSTVLVMLFSILTVIDPPLTVLSIYFNCTISICINKRNITNEKSM